MGDIETGLEGWTDDAWLNDIIAMGSKAPGAASDWLTNLSPDDYFSGASDAPSAASAWDDPSFWSDVGLGTDPSKDERTSAAASPLLASSRTFYDETPDHARTVTGSISGQYDDPTSPFFTGKGATYNPETGEMEKDPSWASKAGKFISNLFKPEPQYDKNGRRLPTSPSSSPAGIMSGAAQSAAQNRLAEAKLSLEREANQNQTYATQQSAQLRAAEIEMMRKRLLNAKRAAAQNTLRNPYATDASKAAARETLAALEQQFAPTSALMVKPPAPVPMPTRPWWETALASAGLAGQGIGAVQ